MNCFPVDTRPRVDTHTRTHTHLCYSVFIYLDNDECLNDNGNCDDICVNSLGSFHCSCREGFSLTSNGIDCEGKYNKVMINVDCVINGFC